MKRSILCLFVLLLASTSFASANNEKNNSQNIIQASDSSRVAELDRFYGKLSKTVREGDYEGYKSTYHKDAVIVFGIGNNKTSLHFLQALQGWKKGFDDTKAGKRKDNVEFRFSQRLGGDTTAHDTGIFFFTSSDNDGNIRQKFVVHFEMLLVKRNGKWYSTMEYQKSIATQEQWEALKK